MNRSVTLSRSQVSRNGRSIDSIKKRCSASWNKRWKVLGDGCGLAFLNYERRGKSKRRSSIRSSQRLLSTFGSGHDLHLHPSSTRSLTTGRNGFPKVSLSSMGCALSFSPGSHARIISVSPNPPLLTGSFLVPHFAHGRQEHRSVPGLRLAAVYEKADRAPHRLSQQEAGLARVLRCNQTSTRDRVTSWSVYRGLLSLP